MYLFHSLKFYKNCRTAGYIFFKGKFQSSQLQSVFRREKLNKCIKLFSNLKLIVWIIVISILSKIIVIMIFSLIEQRYDVLAGALNDIHTEYNIREKIVRTKTDNASNFIKAFRVYAGDEGSTTEEEREDVNDSEKDDEDLEVETEAVEVEALMEEEDECSEYQLPKHHRCACHLLNLISTVDAKKAESKDGYRKISCAAFAKCSALWNKTARSSTAAEVVEKECKLQLIRPVDTRWNSHFLSVERILRIIRGEWRKEPSERCWGHGFWLNKVRSPCAGREPHVEFGVLLSKGTQFPRSISITQRCENQQETQVSATIGHPEPHDLWGHWANIRHVLPLFNLFPPWSFPQPVLPEPLRGPRALAAFLLHRSRLSSLASHLLSSHPTLHGGELQLPRSAHQGTSSQHKLYHPLSCDSTSSKRTSTSHWAAQLNRNQQEGFTQLRTATATTPSSTFQGR